MQLTSSALDRNDVRVNQDLVTKAICRSLVEAPLMLGEVDSVRPFDRSLLGSVPHTIKLNYNQKLGHLYEQALSRLIEHSGQLDLVAQNLQVFDETGRTLGELDLVLQDNLSGRHIHLELAIKFYLGVYGSEGWTFPGPDPKDNWSLKFQRMRAHQWRLCQRPETKALLCELFGIQMISTEHLVLGRIFHPYGTTDRTMPEPVLKSASLGRWLRVCDFEKFFGHVTDVYLVEKPLWLVDSLTPHVDTYTASTVEALKKQAAERCCMFRCPESSEPFFLVPDSWPNRS